MRLARQKRKEAEGDKKLVAVSWQIKRSEPAPFCYAMLWAHQGK